MGNHKLFILEIPNRQLASYSSQVHRILFKKATNVMRLVNYMGIYRFMLYLKRKSITNMTRIYVIL